MLNRKKHPAPDPSPPGHRHKYAYWLLLVGLILAYWPPQLAAQSANQAALIVRFGDGSVQNRCVTFEEPQISGYDLLLRSGLEITVDVQGAGALICAIGDTGCAADNCLCRCPGGGECIYWSYWLQDDGQWQYAPGGASMAQVYPGAVQGWSWGPGAVDAALPPPPAAFEAICTAENTNTAVTPIPINAAPADPAATAVGWPAYALFAAIGLGLTLLIAWVNHRRKPQ